MECYAKFHPERLHVTANPSLMFELYHFKSRMLALVLRRSSVWSWSPGSWASPGETSYKYRHQAEQGSKASFDCAPRDHGLAKPPHIIAAVLHPARHQYTATASSNYTSFISTKVCSSPPILYSVCCPNVPQLCHESQACDRWHAFEALAPPPPGGHGYLLSLYDPRQTNVQNSRSGMSYQCATRSVLDA